MFVTKTKPRNAGSRAPHLPSSLDLDRFLSDRLWEDAEKQVSRALLDQAARIRQLRQSRSGRPQAEFHSDIATAALAALARCSSHLLSAAKAVFLMTKNQGNPEEQQRQVEAELTSRLGSAERRVTKESSRGSSKREARELRPMLRATLDGVSADSIREFRGIEERITNLHLKTDTSVRSMKSSLNPQLEILFLAANPKKGRNGSASDILDLDEEFRAIQSKIQSGTHRDAILLRSHWAVRPQDLLDALNRYRPKIVHFSGHGTTSSGIVLLDDTGGPQLASAEFLLRVFATLAQEIGVVVLNSCFSKEQADAISQVIGVTVGTESSISDRSAISFSEAFYGAIANGLSVESAFKQADTLLTSIRRENRPTLLTRPGFSVSTVGLIRVPEATTYGPLVDALKRTVQKLLKNKEKSIELLKGVAAYAKLVASFTTVAPPNEDATERIGQILKSVVSVCDQINGEFEATGQALDGMSRRWDRFLSVEAVSKLAQLSQLCSDFSEHARAVIQPLSRMVDHLTSQTGLAPASSRPTVPSGPDFLALSGVVASLASLLATTHRSFAVYYNQLLEFLPGELLERSHIQRLELSL